MTRLSSLLSVLASRSGLLVFMNLLFFGSVFFTALVLDFLLPPQLYTGPSGQFSGMFLSDNLILSVLNIFMFNLVVGSFVVVTLPGFVLFPLSAAFLVYRAFIWGALIFQSPSSVFLVTLPTLVLEGEGYVCAGVAGTLVGVSWIRPEWIYQAESESRTEHLKRGLGECGWLYVLVVVVLFIAAIVETATLALIG